VSDKDSLLQRLERAGRRAEDAVLVLVLTGMILLATSQIVLRNFLDIGFIWTDEALRMMVLWLAVAGAVAASRNDRHINIAVLDRFLSDRARSLKDILVHGFTALICGVVAWYGLQFVRSSHEFGDVLLGAVPAWLLQLVLPVGFGLITYRYALFVVRDLRRLVRPEPAA
jgi:TRAP-type C4-dicarboxylate transport system permease small subunit